MHLRLPLPLPFWLSSRRDLLLLLPLPLPLLLPLLLLLLLPLLLPLPLPLPLPLLLPLQVFRRHPGPELVEGEEPRIRPCPCPAFLSVIPTLSLPKGEKPASRLRSKRSFFQPRRQVRAIKIQKNVLAQIPKTALEYISYYEAYLQGETHE